MPSDTRPVGVPELLRLFYILMLKYKIKTNLWEMMDRKLRKDGIGEIVDSVYAGSEMTFLCLPITHHQPGNLKSGFRSIYTSDSSLIKKYWP